MNYKYLKNKKIKNDLFQWQMKHIEQLCKIIFLCIYVFTILIIF